MEKGTIPTEPNMKKFTDAPAAIMASIVRPNSPLCVTVVVTNYITSTLHVL